MDTGKVNAGGNPAMDWHPIWGRVEINVILVTPYYRNRDKLPPDGPLGLCADFTFTIWYFSLFCYVVM